MARSRPLSTNPAVRGRVRFGVRDGWTDDRIVGEVQGSFPRLSESTIRRMIGVERQRQAAVDVLTHRDKRRNVDLARELGCDQGSGRIRMRISIRWHDPESDRDRTYSTTVEVPGQGRLGSILNQAINQATHDALQQGYNIPKMFSTQLSGRESYRIEYAECI